jgi:hypothetical protein
VLPPSLSQTPKTPGAMFAALAPPRLEGPLLASQMNVLARSVTDAGRSTMSRSKSEGVERTRLHTSGTASFTVAEGLVPGAVARAILRSLDRDDPTRKAFLRSRWQQSHSGSQGSTIVPPHPEPTSPNFSVMNGASLTNQQFARQTQAMLNAVSVARIPDATRDLAEDSIAGMRETYERMNTYAEENGKALEEVMKTAEAGVRAIGANIFDNTIANTTAAFDAATAVARANTLAEAAQLQANFVQQQLATASHQSKELFDLSLKVTMQFFESMTRATTRSFEASQPK